MKVTKEQHGAFWFGTGLIVFFSTIIAAGVAFGSPAGRSLENPIPLWLAIQFGPTIGWMIGAFLYLATMPESEE